MDPNETLKELRRMVDEVRDCENPDPKYREELLVDFSDIFSHLDLWLSKKGFLPKEWER
jgi:hypothetical protein